ncbi:MAG: hypothetical protein PHO67_06755 [Candidatus Omnitrophica bacterium]|nr:hypothetical protein [Candidatus Omnitrophota bacterium]
MGKIISAAIAACYIVLAYSAGGAKMAFKIFAFLIIPIGFIWFSEAIGNYTGPVTRAAPLTNKTPAFLIAFVGWVVLLLPAIIGLFLSFRLK